MTHDRIKESERKVFLHTVEDGLCVMFVGVTMLCAAGIVGNAAFMPFFALLILFIPIVINALKRRFTYPRTGYVKLPSEKPQRHALGMLVYFVLALVSMALVLVALSDVTAPAAWRKWAPLLAATLVGGGIHYLTSKSGLTRLYLFQGFSLSVGLVVSLQNSGETYGGVQVYCLLVGACALLMGLAEFVRFVRKYPVREQKENSLAEE